MDATLRLFSIVVCFGALFIAVQSVKSSGRLSSVATEPFVYHGVISEDAKEGAEVKMDVALTVRNRKALADKDICGYTLYKTHSDFPFKIVDVDRQSGLARIVLAPGAHLDYEKKHDYTFEVAAHDCDLAVHSERGKIHVEVQDVNEYAPTWTQSTLSADAVEGRVYDYLLHLEAVDKDGADGVSRICRYHMLSMNDPFEIDTDGYLRNTEPLDYNVKSKYLIDVKAEDCGGRLSEKLTVTINVKPVCKPSWTGISDRVEFLPREGRKLIASGAELELCDSFCNFTEFSVSVKLETEHIGKGCDRDTYSLHSQRKLCGASDSSIDLLPSPTKGSWTKDLPTDDGLESDQIFAFDGKTTAIEIPSSKLDFSLGNSFTVSMWMKHSDTENSAKADQKEHILCHSDGEGMNRHHYSLFVHNCRLVLLLRRNPEVETDDSALRPAEWRWRIPEVCDGRWHHYAASVEFPEVRLYIDGRQFVATRHNPEIVDDWPLHSTKLVHSTKLTVGACWQGGKQKMGQYFHGYLAGLSLLKNKTESDSVIRCLNNCQEKLDFTAIDTNDNTIVSINSERTSLTITGTNLDSVETLLRHVSYVNMRAFPTPGHRPVTVQTNAVCLGGLPLDIDPVTLLVMVVDAERPTITITGTKSRKVGDDELVHGVKIFPDLTIDARTKTEDDELRSSQDSSEQDASSDSSTSATDKLRDRFQLDSCLIRVDPQLSLTIEHLRYPENLVAQLGLDVDFSEDGLVIAGADKLSSYEEVLRGVRYVNSEPEELNSRTFVVSCTELNGRFTSNFHEATLLVTRSIPSPAPAHIAAAVNHAGQQHLNLASGEQSAAAVSRKVETSQTGIGVAVVIVACVGFVVLLVAVGVARIRNAKRHSLSVPGDIPGVTVDDRQEMEWDNSALTITVNPMDQEVMFDDELPVVGAVRHGRVDSDDSSECDEEEESSVAAQNVDVVDSDADSDAEIEHDDINKQAAKQRRELEWDDSTLSF